MSIEHPGGPPGLAERLDDLLLRLDDLRTRPALVWGTGLLLVLVVGFGWWSSRPVDAGPQVEQIPMADPDRGASSSFPGSSDVAEPSGTAASSTGNTASADATTQDLDQEGSDQEVREQEQPEPEELVVHVVGAVHRPGLVSVPPGSRLSDVVTAAGGPLADADIHRLNLAAPAFDGMQVRVPLVDGDEDEVLLVLPERSAGMSSSDTSQPSGPVNLNDATGEQLETLPGIGPAIAAAIISWREENGRFVVPDDLMGVPGIGPAKMGALRDHVTT